MYAFPLPVENAVFDDFVFAVDGRTAAPAGDISKEMTAVVNAAPGAVITLAVQYRSRGLGTWTYAFAGTGVAQVRDFNLTLRTNFREIDFPAGTVSPSEMTIDAERLVADMDVHEHDFRPGDRHGAAREAEPGSLRGARHVLRACVAAVLPRGDGDAGHDVGTSLHPMHYWFIAAAFFAFHLLLAYLVDHVTVHIAFATAAAVSLLLVISYLRLVTGMRRALVGAGSAQPSFWCFSATRSSSRASPGWRSRSALSSHCSS